MALKKSGLGRGLDSLIPNLNSNRTSTNNMRLEEAGSAATSAGIANNKQDIDTASVEQTDKTSSKSNEITNSKPVNKASSNKKADNDKKVDNDKKGLPSIDKGVSLIKLSLIEPNRSQPRMNFDEDALVELADSIKQFGVLQPLLVQPKGEYYELIAGERRWRAAKMAGLKQVPAVVREFTKQETIEIALIENIQRENLNPIEEALAYQRLLTEFNLKQDEVAERVSKSRTAVTNSMRLLKLDSRIQDMIISEMISTGHARALLAIEDREEQYMLAGRIFDESLSVRETEKLVRSMKNPVVRKKTEKYQPVNSIVYDDMAEKMKEVIGTKISVNEKSKGKGNISIEYSSEKELDRIYHMLMTLQDQA